MEQRTCKCMESFSNWCTGAWEAVPTPQMVDQILWRALDAPPVGEEEELYWQRATLFRFDEGNTKCMVSGLSDATLLMDKTQARCTFCCGTTTRGRISADSTSRMLLIILLLPL